jgi:hypothetical protein
VVVDGSNDVFVVGNAGGCLLAKVSGTDGSPIWLKTFPAPDCFGFGLAVDGADDVAITGMFQGTLDFGGGPLSSAVDGTGNGGRDVFVAKFAGSDGSHLWSQRFGHAGEDYGMAAAVDAGGDVLITGFFHDSVDFGGGALTSAGGSDIFLARYSGADGSHVWAKRFGSSDADFAPVASDAGYGIAVARDGHVVLAGQCYGTTDLGGGGLTSAGAGDICVAEYAAVDGSHVWSKRFGGSGDLDAGTGVAVDRWGDVIVTGIFQGMVDFGGGGITDAGVYDVFLAKFAGT